MKTKNEIYTLQGSNGKAVVLINGNKRILFSYDTRVAEYNTKTNKMVVFGWYSLTTGRHIAEFFKMFGFTPLPKKELFKRYNLVN